MPIENKNTATNYYYNKPNNFNGKKVLPTYNMISTNCIWFLFYIYASGLGIENQDIWVPTIFINTFFNLIHF